MTRLGVKLYYLRTREAQLSQQAAADALGIRQATLSHLERGRSLPNHDLLRTVCEFYDVTPTWLLDDARTVVPRITERWRHRDGLLTAGMTVEVEAGAIRNIGGARRLVELQTGDAFFDADATAVRARHDDADRAAQALRRAAAEHARSEQNLEDELLLELAQQLEQHPRRRGTSPRAEASRAATSGG